MSISFSSTYEQLFGDMLADVATWRPHRGPAPPLTACWTECGDSYEPGQGLLVLGRATNGFFPSLNVDELAVPDLRAQRLREIRTNAEGNSDARPLCWVDSLGDADPSGQKRRRLGGTIGSRSAFWRVTHALLKEVKPDLPTTGWAQHLAWGNLCKIAPNVSGVSEGANPLRSLVDRQLDSCAALIRQEIVETRPRVVLVIAGERWYEPFASRLGMTLIPRAGATYVRHVAAEDQGPFWIFTERPERRPQQAFVEELVGAYRELQRL